MVTGMSSGKSEGTHSGPYGAAVMTSFSWFSGKRDPSRKFIQVSLRVESLCGSGWDGVSGCAALAGFELLEQDRAADAHAVKALHARELEDGGDLFARRA